MRANAVEVRFLDDKGFIRAGELASPFTIDHDGFVNIELTDAGELSIAYRRSNDQEHLALVHASRVANMIPVTVQTSFM